MVVNINDIEDKKLLDAVCHDFILRLAPIEWIDKCFGKSQRLVKANNKGQNIYFPAIHDEDGQYFDLRPDNRLGNFLFFVADPKRKNIGNPRNTEFKQNLSIVVFGNLHETYKGKKTSIENFISEFDEAVQSLSSSRKVRDFKSLRTLERIENVYKEYNLKETDGQFLMYPYFALRVDLEVSYLRNECAKPQSFTDNQEPEEETQEQNTNVQITDISINENGFRYTSNKIAIWRQNIKSREWVVENIDGYVIKAQKGKHRIDNYGKYLEDIIENDDSNMVILKWKFPISGEVTIGLNELQQKYED